MRKTEKVRRWKLLSSVDGRIDVYLKKSRSEMPREGAAGWLASNLGLFTSETEKYTVKEFLRRYSEFLRGRAQRNVLLAEVDYEEVYSDKDDKDPNDLEEAMALAYKRIGPNERGNKVLISTLGKTGNGLENDLEATVEAQYYRRHGEGKPGIEVRVLGIPSVLVRQRGEDKRKYETRVRALLRELRTDAKRQRFSKKYESAAIVLIRDYERQLRKVFDVAKTARWLHLNWGGTTDLKPRISF